MLHFLLAEDDDDHAELVLRSIRRCSPAQSVDRVANGLEVMAFVQRHEPYSHKPRPGLVLLDLNMPRLGGLDVLALMKADPDLRDIPVVILSTSDANQDRTLAYQHHANSYLVKPTDFTQFSKMIEEVSLYWGVWNRLAPVPSLHGGKKEKT